MSQAEAAVGVGPTVHDRRTEQAMATIQRYSTWSVIGGLVPLPVVDLIAVGGLQLQMLRRLAAIYDVPFRADRAKSVVASMLGSILPASAATTTAMTLGSALKVVPGLGSAVGLLAMPSFSAGATYLIGRVFMQHFASGGTLLDFHAPDYSEFIKTHSSTATPPAREPAHQ